MKIKGILYIILGMILGVIGYEIYDYIPHTVVKNPYEQMEISPISPYSFVQQEIIDGETFTFPFLPPERAFSLDVSTFQSKREIEEKEYKGIDLEDVTVVEVRFKNIAFLSLRIGIYSPTKNKVIEGGSFALGPNPNYFYKKGDDLTVFFINENRVNVELFSKLNPSAYVVTLPKMNILSSDSLSNDYTKYLIIPTGMADGDTIEVTTFVYNITDKLSSERVIEETKQSESIEKPQEKPLQEKSFEEFSFEERGYGLPPLSGEQYHQLQRTGQEDVAEKVNQRPIFTNDFTRNIQSLDLVKATKDVASYHCFYCEEDWDPRDREGEDKKYFFLDYSDLAVLKSSLPDYIPLQVLGIEAVNGLVGYVDGYLILFPFKFPVDKETFATVQTKGQLQYGGDDTIPSKSSLAGDWRRPRFQNAGEIIDRYLGDDKDWVYYWTPGWAISINRVQKAPDFVFVSSEKKD